MRMISKRQLLVFSILGSFSGSIFGCSNITNASQVHGTYEANHQNGAEMLQLKSDGTYIDTFKASDKADTTTCTGVWEFEPYGGEPQVVLHNFCPHFSRDSEAPIGGTTLLGIERNWGSMRLYLNYDRNQYYSRKSSN